MSDYLFIRQMTFMYLAVINAATQAQMKHARGQNILFPKSITFGELL